jgi:hypothetical protein
MILSSFATWVLSKLAEEAGTSGFWTASQIEGYANELYRDLALNFDCCSTRNETLSTVTGTRRYVIPKATGVDTITRLKGCDYDVTIEGPLDFYTIEQLNSIDMLWRNLTNGTPWGAYFEQGDVNVAVSLVPPPGDVKVLGFDYNYVPSELTDSDAPVEPFTDGIILKDGVMSMALAAPGGGRDMDRSDYYFAMFTSRFPQFTKHKSPVWRGLRSVEDATSIRSIRLPSNYPRYSFD